MLLPLSWLKKFVNVKASAEEIAERLTLSGSEVARVIRRDQGLEGVVVGQIKRIKPHPSADKLRLAYLDVGAGQELEIVCGAANIEAGQKVPTVLVGGRIRDLKIEKKEIRGVKSQGMLASERELGISDNHEGILILPGSAKPGEDAVKFLELDDPIFEFDLTPNRPDCFSAYGIARELAALFDLKLKTYDLRLQESTQPSSKYIKVEVKDKQLCPLYTARVIRDIVVKPSPLWLQNKLRQAGMRPINNVVDITNYAMLETGQPLHAFDLAKIEGGKIIVRRAKKGEKILALDEKTYDLDSETLVIADARQPIALAGVMGGQESGVARETKDVVLEAAVFAPLSVRRTSRRLDLRSESSARFERGLDWEAVSRAASLAARLFNEIAQGKAAKGVVAAVGKKPDRKIIKFNFTDAERLLGVPISQAKAKIILRSLGFKYHTTPARLAYGEAVAGGPNRSSKRRGLQDDPLSKEGRAVVLEVPSWRLDIGQGADLVEEIGRILDYNTLPKTLPEGETTAHELSFSYQLRRLLREYALGWGASEIYTYSFYGEDFLPLSDESKDNHFKLTNPVNEEYPYLRASLLPWLAAKLSKNNLLSSQSELKIFEIGRVFNKDKKEEWQAAIGLVDARSSQENLFRRCRGFLEGFLGQKTEIEKKAAGTYHCKLAGEIAAKIILPKKREAESFRLRSDAGILLIFLDKIKAESILAKKVYRPVPFYPSSERDIAMILPAGAAYKDIVDFVEKFDPLLKKAALFDIYHGLAGGSSVALRLLFYSTDRTLQSQEVDKVMENLTKKLEKRGVVIR